MQNEQCELVGAPRLTATQRLAEAPYLQPTCTHTYPAPPAKQGCLHISNTNMPLGKQLALLRLQNTLPMPGG